MKIDKNMIYFGGAVLALVVVSQAASSIFGSTDKEKNLSAEEEARRNEEIRQKGYLSYLWDRATGPSDPGEANVKEPGLIESGLNWFVGLHVKGFDAVRTLSAEAMTPDQNLTVFTNADISRITAGTAASPYLTSPSVPTLLQNMNNSLLSGETFAGKSKGDY